MSLTKYSDLARELMNAHGLTAWEFRYDGARVRAGCCHYRAKLITMSRHYVAMNVDNHAEIVDTILHEIAHAIAGYGAGHGPKWKQVCVQIGAEPKRCYDSAKVAMPEPKYKANCPTCGKPFTRTRLVGPDKFSYCQACGPEKGLLKFVTATQKSSEAKSMPEILQELKTPEARVLKALMPEDGVFPVYNRMTLAEKAGFKPTTGTINRVLHGIPVGSTSGKPHPGMLELGLMRKIPLDLDGVIETGYRITDKGLRAITHYLEVEKCVPVVRDGSKCTNKRYTETDK